MCECVYCLCNGAHRVLHILTHSCTSRRSSDLIWIAASGKEQGWRRADIALSLDCGGSGQSIYTATGGSVAGVTLTALGAGASTLWDDRNAVEVELDHEGM